jgi:hypothetical protein
MVLMGMSNNHRCYVTNSIKVDGPFLEGVLTRVDKSDCAIGGYHQARMGQATDAEHPIDRSGGRLRRMT